MGVGVRHVHIDGGGVEAAARVRGTDGEEEPLLLLVVQRRRDGQHALRVLRGDAEPVAGVPCRYLVVNPVMQYIHYLHFLKLALTSMS